MRKESLGEHFHELRYRLILALVGLSAGLIACLFFGERFLKIIAVPYETAMRAANLEPVMQAIHPTETFLVYIKTSLLFGLIVTSPWIFYQFWAFVSSGLYESEKRFVYIFVPVTAALFISGSILCGRI